MPSAAASLLGSRRIGSPVDIADNMEEWFRGYGVDGFLVHPPYLPGGIEDFVDLVIPELQSRGLFRAEYEGATLRENLEFERPKSGYSS
jgi:N-acetyl-S-(2-succino)cysteine monooxygenase